MTTPYIGFGNDQLVKQPIVHAGDEIKCPHCQGAHALEGGTENGKPSELLLFYRCGDTPYLAAVQNRLITSVKPVVSGKI